MKKKLTWDAVLKIVIAVVSAVLGAFSAHAMTGK
ncbi:smalltalk protein [Bacteroides sp.]|nr:smalltalk protein [Bacteroides sp.]